MLYWSSFTGRFTQSYNHIPDFREPPVAYEIITCWNCNGDGLVERLNPIGGYELFDCPICGGNGEINTSIEQFPFEDYMIDLGQLGLLQFLSNETNIIF